MTQSHRIFHLILFYFLWCFLQGPKGHQAWGISVHHYTWMATQIWRQKVRLVEYTQSFGSNEKSTGILDNSIWCLGDTMEEWPNSVARIQMDSRRMPQASTPGRYLAWSVTYYNNLSLFSPNWWQINRDLLYYVLKPIQESK